MHRRAPRYDDSILPRVIAFLSKGAKVNQFQSGSTRLDEGSNLANSILQSNKYVPPISIRPEAGDTTSNKVRDNIKLKPDSPDLFAGVKLSTCQRITVTKDFNKADKGASRDKTYKGDGRLAAAALKGENSPGQQKQFASTSAQPDLLRPPEAGFRHLWPVPASS